MLSRIRVSLEYVRHSPTVNVFWALSKEGLQGPFFEEMTFTRIVYLRMLQQFFLQQSPEGDRAEHFQFQQDGAPFRCLGKVRENLKNRFPGRWISGAAPIA
jgi:hypothetical protein